MLSARISRPSARVSANKGAPYASACADVAAAPGSAYGASGASPRAVSGRPPATPLTTEDKNWRRCMTEPPVKQAYDNRGTFAFRLSSVVALAVSDQLPRRQK